MSMFDHLNNDQLRNLRNAYQSARRGRKPADYDRMTRKLNAVYAELERRGVRN